MDQTLFLNCPIDRQYWTWQVALGWFNFKPKETKQREHAIHEVSHSPGPGEVWFKQSLRNPLIAAVAQEQIARRRIRRSLSRHCEMKRNFTSERYVRQCKKKKKFA